MAEAWTSLNASQPKAKNTDTKENALLADECSKTHCDIIQQQEKKARLMGRVESLESVEVELQRSMVNDQELTDMRSEFCTSASPTLSLEGSDLEPPEAMELIMCMEEPEVEEIMDDIPQTTLTPATPLPESPSFISAPEILSQTLHYLPCPQELLLTTWPAPVSEPAESHMSSESESTDESKQSQISLVSPTEEAPLKAQMQLVTPAAHSFGLPVLLTGGVAILAIVGIMTYVVTRK